MKKLLVILLAAMMLVGVLAGCGPAEAKILTYATTDLKGVFNPLLSDDVYDTYVCDMIFAALVSNNPAGEPVPELAEKWEVSEDKLTYTFTLKDAKFSNGDPVTAEDVKFTYEMMCSPDYNGSFGYSVSNLVGYAEYNGGTAQEVTGIKVIDPKTVSFTITDPYAAKIYDFGYGILEKSYYESDTYEAFQDKNNAPMGAGQFVFEEYQPDQFCKLVRNDNYFDGAVKLDGVTVLIIPEETQIDALLNGEVDIINPSANKENFDRMDGGDNTHGVRFVGNGYNYIGLNLQDPILADKNVRKALAYGLDVQKFIDNEYEGFAEHCITPISPVSWAYPQDMSTLDTYAYNPEKAAQLLADAGWTKNADGILEKDGKKFELTWTSYTDVPWPEHLISLAKEQWGALGISLEGELLDFNSVSTKVFDEQDFQMWSMGWSLSIDPDPVGIFDAASFVKGGYNAGGYSNARAEEIFQAGRLEFDQAKRAALYQEWAQIANDDLPYIFVAIREEIWGVNDRVTGLDDIGPYYNWVYCLDKIDIK